MIPKNNIVVLWKGPITALLCPELMSSQILLADYSAIPDLNRLATHVEL